jgi:hypothetical protein
VDPPVFPDDFQPVGQIMLFKGKQGGQAADKQRRIAGTAGYLFLNNMVGGQGGGQLRYPF